MTKKHFVASLFSLVLLMALVPLLLFCSKQESSATNGISQNINFGTCATNYSRVAANICAVTTNLSTTSITQTSCTTVNLNSTQSIPTSSRYASLVLKLKMHSSAAAMNFYATSSCTTPYLIVDYPYRTDLPPDNWFATVVAPIILDQGKFYYNVTVASTTANYVLSSYND